MTADTAYGSGDTLDWVVRKKKILPFIPVFDKSTRTDGTWSRSDFEWDEQNDRYLCPEGHELPVSAEVLGPEQEQGKAGAPPLPSTEDGLPDVPVEIPLLSERGRAGHHPRGT